MLKGLDGLLTNDFVGLDDLGSRTAAQSTT